MPEPTYDVEDAVKSPMLVPERPMLYVGTYAASDLQALLDRPVGSPFPLPRLDAVVRQYAEPDPHTRIGY